MREQVMSLNLPERFSWKWARRGLERQKESNKKEKILSDGG